MSAVGGWSSRDVLLPVLLIAAPLFFLGGPDWLSPPLTQELWSQGHWLFFSALLYWWQGRWPLRQPRHWLLATLMVLLLSALVEGLQTLVGRQAGWNDVLCNVLGTWLGLFWGQRATRRVWAGRAVATVLLLWPLQGLLVTALAHGYQHHRFPVLGDFESGLDAPFWEGRVQRVTDPAVQGRYSLAIDLGGDRGRYTGVHLKHLVGDWRGYQSLAFSLYNPGSEALSVTLRINDTRHERGSGRYEDRFNRSLTVAPGWNHYRIELSAVAGAPQGRSMALDRIQRLLFFVTDMAQTRRIYLDHLRLETTHVEPDPTATDGTP